MVTEKKLTVAEGWGSAIRKEKARIAGKEKWIVRIYSPPQDGGRRIEIKRTFIGSEEEANQFRERLLIEEVVKAVQTPPKGDVITFKKLAVDMFLNGYLAAENNSNKYDRYESLLRVHILPVFGDTRLDELDYSEVLNWAKGLRETAKLTQGKGVLSPATVRHIIVAFKRILNHGASIGECKSLPWVTRIPTPNASESMTRNNTKGKAFRKKEVAELLKAVKDTKYYTFVAVALGTGMHLSELLGLTWQDIRLDSQLPYINYWRKLRDIPFKHQTEGDPVYQYGEPKKPWRARKINLDPNTAELLKEYKRTAEEYLPFFDEETPVFCAFTNGRSNKYRSVIAGEPWRVTTTSHEVNSIINKLGMRKGLSLKSTRHTHATDLLENGVSIDKVANRLGHKDAGETYRTYRWTVDHKNSDAIEALENINYLGLVDDLPNSDLPAERSVGSQKRSVGSQEMSAERSVGSQPQRHPAALPPKKTSKDEVENMKDVDGSEGSRHETEQIAANS